MSNQTKSDGIGFISQNQTNNSYINVVMKDPQTGKYKGIGYIKKEHLNNFLNGTYQTASIYTRNPP